MANVINRITKQYLKSVNTPDYPVKDWIINPILPECDSKHYVVEGDIIREMTQVEKNNLVYSTESSVYLIIEKQLLSNINGYAYESNLNAIINPIIPDCNIKYTRVIDNVIVEMNQNERDIVDLPDKINKQKEDLATEIALVYTISDEIDILRRIAFGSLKTSAQEAINYVDVVEVAKVKYPKPE